MDYKFKTQPFDHQLKHFLASRDLEHHGVLWEQRTGKTKLLIDTAAYLHCQDKIDAVLIIAPKGVHRNWTNIELPIHLPDYFPSTIQCWPKYNDKELFDFNGLHILSMNIDALNTEKGFALAQKFLANFKALLIVDESSTIANPSAQRTKKLMALKKWAKYRRIAEGTPSTNSPFSIYSQFKFLDEEIFGSSFISFKHRYAVFCDESDKKYMAIKRKLPPKAQRFFEMVKEDSNGKPMYANLNELSSIINKHSSRVLRAECFDLPPKMYSVVNSDLSDEQRKTYKSVRQKLESKFIEEGDEKTLTISIALTRVMRLQQITGGFVKYDEDLHPTLIGEEWQDIPKMVSLIDTLKESSGKVIIWDRFQAELGMINQAIGEEFGPHSMVSYHGGISDKDKEAAINSFQDQKIIHIPGKAMPIIEPCPSSVKFFIGQAQSGGRGITLNKASHVIYYSNLDSYIYRAQSEDRAQGKHAVAYDDIIVDNTVDAFVLDALKHHKDVADVITGDREKFMDMVFGSKI